MQQHLQADRRPNSNRIAAMIKRQLILHLICIAIGFDACLLGAQTNDSSIDTPQHSTSQAANEEESDKDAAALASGQQADKFQTLDSLFTLYQPYLGNIAPYQSIYFLFGTQPEKSKGQISLKYRLFNPEGSWSKKYPWFQGFHLAYTQRSFWNLASDSKPFDDNSYMPEFFFLSSNIDIWQRSRFFVQTGYRHESNGQSDSASREIDVLYARPIFILYSEKTRLGIQIAPEVWGYLTSEPNRIPDYRGYFDLEVKLGQADGLVLESHFSWAREGGSCQVDLTYPLHRFLFNNINLYLQIQYANRLAESLLHYDTRSEALRIGFGLIR